VSSTAFLTLSRAAYASAAGKSGSSSSISRREDESLPRTSLIETKPSRLAVPQAGALPSSGIVAVSDAFPRIEPRNL
jgi:hypothetical protein